VGTKELDAPMVMFITPAGAEKHPRKLPLSPALGPLPHSPRARAREAARAMTISQGWAGEALLTLGSDNADCERRHVCEPRRELNG